MTDTTELLEFFPGQDSCGDPIGYVRGHVTRAECIASMMTQGWYDEGDEAEDAEVWHGWIRCVPAHGQEFDTRWVPEDGPSAGAFAVTLWVCMRGRKKWCETWRDAP